MTTIDYIARTVNKLVVKYQSRNPYKLCSELGIKVKQKDLGEEIKAYYYCTSRICNIVLNNRISEDVQRILVAHELGHERLHKELAQLQGFQEVELFVQSIPFEYEANLFAAELLIDDEELLVLLSDEDKSYNGVASVLRVPADFLDFKVRVIKHRGLVDEAQYMANLSNGKISCIE